MRQLAQAGMMNMGIRGRIGRWSWDAVGLPLAEPTDRVLRRIEDEVRRYPARSDRRIAAWPILTGRQAISDALWQGAKAIADANGLGLSFHMSPVASDPAWFLEHHGCRPVEHLARLGVLGANVAMTHGVHFDRREV